MEIYLGLEIDYIPGLIGPAAPQFQNLDLDYKIGSVHFVGTFDDGMHWTVDGSPERFARGLAETFSGEAQRLVEGYYGRICAMLENEPPNILGHLDLVKLHNRDNRYFSEGEDWYRDAVISTLNAVHRAGVILEVNCGGINKGLTQDFYPSPWVLKHCRDLEIPIILSADAHRPEKLTGGFAAAAKMLLEVGYQKLTALQGGRWRSIGLSEDGLRW
jgi:histidinol-phosphatase (PHP family)